MKALSKNWSLLLRVNLWANETKALHALQESSLLLVSKTVGNPLIALKMKIKVNQKIDIL